MLNLLTFAIIHVAYFVRKRWRPARHWCQIKQVAAAALLIVLTQTVAVFQSVGYASDVNDIKVVATGDSHTVRYSRHLQAAFDALDPGRIAADAFAVAGADAPEYAGLFPSPLAENRIIDFPAEVLALDPDVIVFMLGTNDAGHDAFGHGYFENYYQPLVPDFIEEFVRSRAKVIIMNPPPVLPVSDVRATTNQILINTYQPFLAALADQRDISLLDLRAAFLSRPNWESLYSEDGVHLTKSGYQLMADIVAAAVLQGYPPRNSDDDGVVDIVDLNNVRNNFGLVGADVRGDIIDDDIVDLLDLNAVRNYFGVRTVSLPEPSGLTLLMISGYFVCLARLRKRR